MKTRDDVIRIRIDASRAVAEFMALLAEQAAEGETNAPANPANRAIYRELAPFRLVEYAYVAPVDSGEIEGAYVGFADGALYAVSEDIPEAVIDALVAQDVASLPPVYIYLLLADSRSSQDIDKFLVALAMHLNRPLVGVYRDGGGRMTAHSYDLDAAVPLREALARECTCSVLEADRHLDKAHVLRRLVKRNLAADGRAFAHITYRYTQHVAEFINPVARDDFIAWSRTLCEWIYARWWSWEDMGLTEILRPAEIAAEPQGETAAVRLVAPSDFDQGTPWRAFGGSSAATALHFTQSEAALNDAAMQRSLALAQGYWRYVTDAIASGEALARALSDDRRRRGMKLD